MKPINNLIVYGVIILMIATNTLADLNNGLVAHYPFSGNAVDYSGNGLNGTAFGATLSNDRFGNPNSAYFLDGIDDYIRFPPMPTVGVHSLSVSFWIKSDYFNPADNPGILTNAHTNKWTNEGRYTVYI